MKIGDIVLIEESAPPFFSAGDKAKLVEYEGGTCWWGDFNGLGNKTVHGQGVWCLMGITTEPHKENKSMKVTFEALTTTDTPISRRGEMMLSLECHMDHDQAMNALKALRDAMAPAIWEAMLDELAKEEADDLASFPVPADPNEEAQWERDRARLVREEQDVCDAEYNAKYRT
jgi:hypothetical protein